MFTDDIVLLQLNEPVELSQLITPACLYEPATPSDGTICYATGWGRTGKFFVRDRKSVWSILTRIFV